MNQTKYPKRSHVFGYQLNFANAEREEEAVCDGPIDPSVSDL